MAALDRYLPAPLRGMPPEDWRYIGAALLGVAGTVVWIAAFRTRRNIPMLGDSCPVETYIEFIGGQKKQGEKRSRRAWLYSPYVRYAANYWGIEPHLLAGLIHTESGFKPTAGSGAGAVGLTQFMPNTAVGRYNNLVEQNQWPFDPLPTKDVGDLDEQGNKVLTPVNGDPKARTLFRKRGVEAFLDRTNPFQAIWMGASGMRSKFDRGWDFEHALASYNAGEGRVTRTMPRHEWPQETQNYVTGVTRRMQWYDELWNEICPAA